MPSSHDQVESRIKRYFEGVDEGEMMRRLAPMDTPFRAFHLSTSMQAHAVHRRRQQLPWDESIQRALIPEDDEISRLAYEKNIEGYVGQITVPLAVLGPLRIRGLHAHGDYPIPMATTEAALVASCHRGCVAIGEAGGASAMLVAEGVTRAPGFCFDKAIDAILFVRWISEHEHSFHEVVAQKTRHGKLVGIKFTLEGNEVHVHFTFSTGDASGQNMVTIATEALCHYLVAHCPHKPQTWFVEANMSGDKKATMLSFTGVRGKKVVAEIRLSPEVVRKRLRTTPQAMAQYCAMAARGGMMSGSIGTQGHYANSLAALYLATGQDVACVSESSVGVTRMEVEEDGSLYVAVTLPNLILGTVGGGTSLPSQQACLQLMGLAGSGHASALAEVAAGLALAGELSIIAALSAGHFTMAHQRLARGRVPHVSGSENISEI